MFYYRITERRVINFAGMKESRTIKRVTYHQVGAPKYIGSTVADRYANASNIPKTLTVQKISQRTYIRATRPGE